MSDVQIVSVLVGMIAFVIGLLVGSAAESDAPSAPPKTARFRLGELVRHVASRELGVVTGYRVGWVVVGTGMATTVEVREEELVSAL